MSALRGHRPTRWLAVGLAIITAGSLAACGSSSDNSTGTGGSTAGASTGASTTASDKPVKIAYLVATQAAGYPVGMLKAAKEQAAKENATIDIFDAQFDPSKQVAQCQDAITKGTYDAIVTLAAASPPMTVCAQQAKDAGIPLIAANTPIGTDLENFDPTVDGVTSQVIIPAKVAWGTKPDQGIGHLLPAMCKQVKGTCDVAFIEGVQALALSGAAAQAVKDVVAANPNMKLSGSCVGNYQREGGLKCAQDLLQKDPKINVIVSQSDDMALGAEGAIKDAGKTPGKDILIGTQGGSTQGVQRIQDGQWYGSILSLATPEGAIPITLAAAAARGKDVPKSVDPNKETGMPLVLDQDNKGDYPDFKGQFEG